MSFSEDLFRIRYSETHSLSEQLALVNEIIQKSLSSESGYIGERAAKLFSDSPLKTSIVADHIRFELNRYVNDPYLAISFKADEVLYLISEFHDILDPVPIIKEIYKDQYHLLEKEISLRKKQRSIFLKLISALESIAKSNNDLSSKRFDERFHLMYNKPHRNTTGYLKHSEYS